MSVGAGAGPLCSGLDAVLDDMPAALRGARVGLLSHAAAVDAAGRHAADLLAARDDLRLVRLFAPEHGLRGERPAGDPVPDGVDAPTGLPVISLYRGGAPPVSGALEGLDAVLADLQDIGCRYFTYPGTLRRFLAESVRAGVPLHVLDRPNPLGGAVAGPADVPAERRSLVSAFDVPVRHGLTVGELALLAAREDGAPVGALQVHRARGWRRADRFAAWGRPWVPPSPNATCAAMAELYPGACLIEATNLSEGRGTPYPFRQIGAPWLDAHRLAEGLRPLLPQGLVVRPAWFIPTASKHAGQLCQGVFLDVLPGVPPVADAGLAVCVRLLALLQEDGVVEIAPARGAGGTPWLDRLLGGPDLRLCLESAAPCEDLLAAWRAQAARFEAGRPVCLYD